MQSVARVRHKTRGATYAEQDAPRTQAVRVAHYCRDHCRGLRAATCFGLMSIPKSSSLQTAPANPSRIVVCGTLAMDMIGHYHKGFSALSDGQALNVSMQLDRFALEFGGCAMNICYTLSLLGGVAFPIVRAGRDFHDGYAQHLARHGIDVSGVLVDEDFAYSSRCMILSDGAGNQVTAFYPGSSSAAASRERPHVDAGEFAIRNHCALAVIAPDVPETMIRHATLLQAAGVKCITDPGQGLADFSAEALQTLLNNTRCLIVNAMEWQTVLRLLKVDAARVVAELDWLIVTHGGEGAQIHRPATAPHTIGAVPPTAYVDHTGCGDALRAGLAWGIARGCQLEDALSIGMLAATFNLEVSGCQRHVFTLAAFAARYSNAFGRQWPLPTF